MKQKKSILQLGKLLIESGAKVKVAWFNSGFKELQTLRDFLENRGIDDFRDSSQSPIDRIDLDDNLFDDCKPVKSLLDSCLFTGKELYDKNFPERKVLYPWLP